MMLLNVLHQFTFINVTLTIMLLPFSIRRLLGNVFQLILCVCIVAFVNGIFNKSEPPPQSDLEKLRAKRKQELRAQEALMNLIFYAIFMFIIYSISYIERDHRAFFMKSNLENYLVGHGYGQLGFSGVHIFVSTILLQLVPSSIHSVNNIVQKFSK